MENLTPKNIRLCLLILSLWFGFSGQIFSASGNPRNPSPTPNRGGDPVLFTFNCIDGQPGDTICIPVTVENFTDIVIAQFEIFWDSDVLDYIEIRNPGLPEINTNGDFNLSGPNSLRFIPLNFDDFNGENLPDDAVLYEICFRIIGTPGSSSTITISPYFTFEIVDLTGVIPADSVPCSMTVNDAVDLVGFVTSCGPAIAGGNGEIDVTVYGGTAPYNITWLETITVTPGGPIGIPAEGGSMVINAPRGNYDVMITDALGGSVSYNIDVDSLGLSVITRVKHPTCYEFDNGTIGIKPQGGSAPYSFIWESLTGAPRAGSGFIRNLGDSSLVTSLHDGIYRILVKDDNGCEVEIMDTLNYNPFVFTIDDYQDATCIGVEDGFISLIISGATPDSEGNYTITTQPGFEITTNTVTIFHSPGTYSITIEDQVSQCDTVYTFTIGSSTVLSATITPTDVSCAGSNDGSVSVRGLTNGVAGPTYSYTILNSDNTVETNANNHNGIFTYNSLSPGDYSVIVKEGACLSDTLYFTIGEPLPMIVTVGGTTIDDCLDFPQFATGTAWFNIQNGTAPYILDAGAGDQDADTIRDLQDGNYIVTVTDDNGCTSTAAFTIFAGDGNEEADISFDFDGTPCEGGTITLLYQGSAILPPGSSVSWNNNSFSGQTIVIPGPGILEADLFIPSIHCMLNDTLIINCQAKLELDITVNNPLCHDEAVGGPFTGTVIVDTVNAVAPVTFYWSFPDTTTTGIYSGLSPGIYYVTVTDANDSIAIDTFEIVAPDALHFNFGVPDSTSCNDICDGAVMVNPIDGDPSLDYFLFWTTDVQNADTGVFFQIQDLCAGITEFSVSQDGVCFYEGEIEILTPEPIDIDLVQAFDATCHGDSDGSIEVVASGGSPGYTYSWTGGPSTALYSGIPAGEYFVTAVDSKNCEAIDSFSITEPDSLIAKIDLTGTLDLSCGASNDGIVTVDVSGGNDGGYTFQWNPDVSTIYQAVNLAAGQYLITVTDPKGCTDTTAYTLSSPPPIVVEWPSIEPPACFGDETLLQIDNVMGGNGNYSFNINGGQLLDIGEPVLIPSGIYIVSVFDDRGCSADSTYTVMEPNPILVSIGPDDPIIDLGDSLFIIGNIDQSDNPISMMMWTADVPVGCPTCEGTWVFNFIPTLYTWTVTDVNGCQGSASILVGVDYDRDVYFPSVFTPNNDGRNDEFMIFTGPGVELINYFHIYDRWGNLVHTQTNLLPNSSGAGSWDGTFNGKELSPGVYVYVAEVQFIDENTTLVFKGDITLIK